jgi:sugar-specific transcriptional regulator TrmB
MDEALLEDIGLTKSEIKVFLALLDLGSATAGRIIDKSGLQSGVVHRAFHSLGDKGLLTYSLVGRIKEYQAIDPNLLLVYLDEKRNKLKDIIPELRARASGAKTAPNVVVYQGVKGVKELLNHMLETKEKEYVAYGGNQANVDLLGDFFWKNFHTKRYTSGIAAKLIFHDSIRHWIPILTKYPITEVRTTKEIYEEMTETVVCGNRVGILVFREKPYGILIEEEVAASSYRKFFDILWKNATP